VPRSKNEWSYTSTSPILLHGVVLSKSTGTTLPLPLLGTLIKVKVSVIAQSVQRWATGWTSGVLGFDSRRGIGNFSLHHRVQNDSGAHPASYAMGTRGSFLGGIAHNNKSSTI
jgi:hypothetical protein